MAEAARWRVQCISVNVNVNSPNSSRSIKSSNSISSDDDRYVR
jgi:hypothetical protein